jgi:glutaredoxin 3
LDANSVAYQDLNVAEDRTAREELVKKSGQMPVPIINIDGDIVVGYDEAALKEKLGL